VSTTFTTLSDERAGDEWPEGEHDIVTLVEGDLAERVLAKVGKASGVVTIEEHGTEGGYSEYTVEWEYDFRVLVGGEEVWKKDWLYGNTVFDDLRYGGNGLTEFLKWLDAPA
jgi:hypothetical protein